MILNETLGGQNFSTSTEKTGELLSDVDIPGSASHISQSQVTKPYSLPNTLWGVEKNLQISLGALCLNRGSKSPENWSCKPSDWLASRSPITFMGGLPHFFFQNPIFSVILKRQGVKHPTKSYKYIPKSRNPKHGKSREISKICSLLFITTFLLLRFFTGFSVLLSA